MKISCVFCAVRLRSGGALFKDHLRISVRGGTGGSGLPDLGGVGGDGGDVYLTVTPRQTLAALAQNRSNMRFVGHSGHNSRKLRILGAKGANLDVPVPIGITVTTDDGTILGELNSAKDRLLVAEGGEGGSPKTNFRGQSGASRIVRLDMKLIADIGLVGFPNAGKSTLLNAISRAKPKIANYPFTTIKPQVGIIKYDDLRTISMADLPGLIEGAHRNVGMGHRFLKHVERTLLLLLVVDIHGFQLKPTYPFRSAVETVLLLNKELEMYNADLLWKPAVLCVNKIDTEAGRRKLDDIMQQLNNLEEHVSTLPEELRPERLIRFENIIPISAKQSESIADLKLQLRHTLDRLDDKRRSERIKQPTEKELLETSNSLEISHGYV